MQDTLSQNETVVEQVGEYTILKIDNTYRVETVEVRYQSKRKAVIAAKLLDEAGICPSVYNYNAASHIPAKIANRGKNMLAAWYYLASDDSDTETDYWLVRDHLDVSEQTARNYVSRYLNS